MKKILILSTILLFGLLLASCDSSDSKTQKTEITIWVGSESVNFYQNVLDEYVETEFYNLYPDFVGTHPKIVVKSSNAADAAKNYITDIDAAADIFTIPSNNLVDLVSNNVQIAPIKGDTAFADYIRKANNSEIMNVISGILKNGEEVIYGVPYVSQNLILYYNKSLVNPTDVKSFEGLIKASGTKKAFTLSSTAGYDNSFLILANDGNNNYPVDLYKDGILGNCNLTSDQAVNLFLRGQELFKDGYLPTPDGGWSTSLRSGDVLSVIAGAWDFKAASAALGQNLGIAALPTFTVSDTTYHAGTFNDVKMFVQKINSPFAEYLSPIIKYLTSSTMQEASFLACDNLPSHVDAENFAVMNGTSLKIELAKAQFAMLDYGKPQPFVTREMNTNYYRSGTDTLFIYLLRNESGNFSSFESVKAQLSVIEELWKKVE